MDEKPAVSGKGSESSGDASGSVDDRNGDKGNMASTEERDIEVQVDIGEMDQDIYSDSEEPLASQRELRSERSPSVIEADEERAGGHAHSSPPSNPTANSLDAPPTSRRVFVGNIPYHIKWQGLKDHMQSAGQVIYVEIVHDAQGNPKVQRKGFPT